MNTGAARVAIANWAARRTHPVRCNDLTERTVLARLHGRPNDVDFCFVANSGTDKALHDRWELIRRSIVLTSKLSNIFRNEIPVEDVQGAKAASGGKNFQLMADAPANVMMDMHEAIKNDCSKKLKMYFFDNRGFGVAKFARVKIDFATDDPLTAQFLSQMLPQFPKSSIPKKFEKEKTILLLHNSSKDAVATDIDSYLAHDSIFMIARGLPPTMTTYLEVFSKLASKTLLSQDVLVIKGDVCQKAKSGPTSIVFGSPDSESSVAIAGELQASGLAVWGAPGLSRAWEGSLQQKDNITAVKPISSNTLLNQPKSLIFVVNKSKPGKPLTLETAKKLFLTNYAVTPDEKAGQLFEKFIQANQVELIIHE